MKPHWILYFIIALILVTTACEKMDDFYLSGSVFIEDPYYPGLPIYSEWGYNTFGAYIDREPFVSTYDDLPVKVIVNGDVMHMILKGRMEYEDVEFTFSVTGYSPQTHSDLTEMDSLTIDLTDPGCSVTMETSTGIQELDLIEGELNFHRVQRLYVDEELSRTIMSGYFQLKTFLDNEPISMTHGRFDLGIGYENFYNY